MRICVRVYALRYRVVIQNVKKASDSELLGHQAQVQAVGEGGMIELHIPRLSEHHMHTYTHIHARTHAHTHTHTHTHMGCLC